MSEGTREKVFMAPSIGKWPQEFLERLNLPPMPEVNLDGLTDEEKEKKLEEWIQLCQQKDKKHITPLLEEFKQEKVEILFPTDSAFQAIVKHIVDVVPLSQFDAFMNRCPHGEELFQLYNDFLTHRMNVKQIPSNISKEFVEYILKQFIPKSEIGGQE